MSFINNDISLILVLAMASMTPFVIAAGTCFLKFSVVFTLLRNGLGLQQVPSNMVLNALALMLAFYVMQPVVGSVHQAYTESGATLDSVAAVGTFLEDSLGAYKEYLSTYSDPDLLDFFEKARHPEGSLPDLASEPHERSLSTLLPAYALSELKDAFRIGFYLYLPFVVIDLVVSSILLSLGMMMMSPVTISAPIKLILFVAVDGWDLLARGLVRQYLDVPG